MKLVFMGTPLFAVRPLQALAQAGHELGGVVTRIDKPAGRGRAVAQPAVKIAAQQMGFTVHQPGRVRDLEFIETLRKIAPDVIVVAAYGQILPKDILELPKYGCVNIHASLLPLYRGAAPINWAIIRGETETGITIMQMDEGMDTGAILMQESMPIDPKDTAGTVTEKLSDLGAGLIGKALLLIKAGSLKPVLQDHAKATLAPILKKQDGLVDWTSAAAEIHNRVRGVNPWPGAYTYLDGKLIKILETGVADGQGGAGVIHERDGGVLEVGTGTGLIHVLRIQPEGRKPMTAADFIHGHRGLAGKRFSGPDKHGS
jgi:methionyl-tRNA formyltransferase